VGWSLIIGSEGGVTVDMGSVRQEYFREHRVSLIPCLEYACYLSEDN